MIDPAAQAVRDRYHLIQELNFWIFIALVVGLVLVILMDFLKNWKSWTKYRNIKGHWAYWGRWFWFFIAFDVVKYLGFLALMGYFYWRTCLAWKGIYYP